MASEYPEKVSVKMQLEDGQTSTGKIRTVGVNMGTLKVDTFNNDKAMAIVAKLAPMFDKTLYETQKTAVSVIEEE